eukprot:scaffold27354_cov115-Amphora_coffeaeformis.AAC.1
MLPPLKWQGKWAGGWGEGKGARGNTTTAEADGEKGRCRANAITPRGRRGLAKAVVPLKWQGKWAGGWGEGKGARGNTATAVVEQSVGGGAKAVERGQEVNITSPGHETPLASGVSTN